MSLALFVAQASPGTPPLVADIAARAGIDLAAIVALARGVYGRHHRRQDLVATLASCNLTVFLIALLLNRVQVTTGAAFGLFAVFSMLRFRTEGLSARDMSYLFLSVSLGLLLGSAGLVWWELAAIAALIIGTAELLESRLLLAPRRAQPVLYENIALIKGESREALIADLRSRTGLNVQAVDVVEIDFVRDSARLTVYHDP